MSMYDSFEPKEKFRCPVCYGDLKEWQGYDLDCVLAKWKEGIKHPVGSDLNEESIGENYYSAVSSVKEFFILSHDCDCSYPIYLKCTVKGETWDSTQMYTGTEEDRKHTGGETKSAFKKRMQWLDSKL